jgi:non-ribosomal peptide synthetase component E (peptide arylation enzyme)
MYSPYLIHHFLENSAERFPDKTALVHEDVRAPYSEINFEADRIARFLVGQGVAKGDRVVLAPAEIKMVKALPRNASGKIDRAKCLKILN